MSVYFPSIFFTVDVQHSHDLADVLRSHDIKAYPISGKTPKDERRRFIRMFKEGQIDGLVSCGVLQEGFDAPIAMGAFMGKPTRSGLNYRQSAGRVLRPFPPPKGKREYQGTCLAAIGDNLDSGVNLQLAVLPTGTGKTYIAAHVPKVVNHWKGGKPRGRTLFITHRDELVTQTADTFREWQPHLTVGIEQAKSYASNADVVVASIQTLGVGECIGVNDGDETWEYTKRLLSLNPDQFDTVILDEAHHAVKGKYYWNVLRHMRILKGMEDLDKGKLLLCITATPSRSDNAGMEAICDKIVYSYDMRDAIKDGYMAPVRAFRVETEADISQVHTTAGEFNMGELQNAVNTPVRNELIAREYLSIRESIKGELTETANGFRKPFAVIADFVDNTGKHSLIVAPTLFGLREKFDPKGKDMSEVIENIERMEAEHPGLDLRSEESAEAVLEKIKKIKTSRTVLDLLKPPEVSPEMRKLSKFAWLTEGVGAYHVGLMDSSMLSIRENTLGQHEIYRHVKGVRTKLSVAHTLKEAVAMAEREIPDNDRRVMNSDAGWRKEPPSEKQCQRLFMIDRRMKKDFKSASELFAYAQARHHGGDPNFSRGAMSQRLTALDASRQ